MIFIDFENCTLLLLVKKLKVGCCTQLNFSSDNACQLILHHLLLLKLICTCNDCVSTSGLCARDTAIKALIVLTLLAESNPGVCQASTD